MTLLFTLSMPNRGSWNGRWSGENNFYGLFKTFKGKKQEAKALELLKHHGWHFSWGDGWGANVSVRRVESFEVRGLKKACMGFCGYEWMVESILVCGEIHQTVRDGSGKVIQSPYIEKEAVTV